MPTTRGLPADLAEGLTRAGGRLAFYGEPLHWYDDVVSTNDVAAMLAERGAGEGTVVAADAQSAGRGRLGRRWSSPRGAGLYVSVVLRPRSKGVGLLTIAAGVAVCEGIRAATGLTPDLKWPNDALLGGRKVAGILAEGGAAEGAVRHVVLGIGINVSAASHPPDVAARATSLERELGRGVDRGLVLAEVLAAVAAQYGLVQQGRQAPVLAAWRQFAAATLGRPIEWQADATKRRGIARDIDDGGALLVDTPTRRERVIAGTVDWL